MKNFIIILIIALIVSACSKKSTNTENTTQKSKQISLENQNKSKAEETSPAMKLKIEDLKLGNGKEAKKDDQLRVHYVGYLSNGTKFDSSYDFGRPFSFQLGAGKVIKGWEEGLSGMKEGGKRKLTIPPDLAYGSRGAGALIPPDATLIFEVELLKVN